MKALLFFDVLLTFVWITPVFAVEVGESPLTLARVIELAASIGPEVRISKTHVVEEEAKLAGAKVRTIENPKLELAAGPRSGDESSLDTDLALEIPIELWGRRDKRILPPKHCFSGRNTHLKMSGANQSPRRSVPTTKFSWHRNRLNWRGSERFLPKKFYALPPNAIRLAMSPNLR